MNWESIHKLLDKLDTAVNSNSFWIELGLPSGEFEIGKVLVQHLKTGNFHFELVKQDISRDWNNYSEMVFSKSLDQIVLIPRPGNVWNGKEKINYQEIPRNTIYEHLFDLLTGKAKYYGKSSYGTQFTDEEADSLVVEVLEMLTNLDKNWKAYLITPDFLNVVENYFDSGYIKLGYFENHGRDMSLAFLVDDSLYILLTNGYA